MSNLIFVYLNLLRDQIRENVFWIFWIYSKKYTSFNVISTYILMISYATVGW